MIGARARWPALLTYEVDYEPAVGRAAGGAAEEGLAVRRPARGAPACGREVERVPRVGEGVAEAEDAVVPRPAAAATAVTVRGGCRGGVKKRHGHKEARKWRHLVRFPRCHDP